MNDRGLAAISCLRLLEDLDISCGKDITNFEPLSKCQQLKKLNLFSTSIDSEGLAAVARLPLLEDLDLSKM